MWKCRSRSSKYCSYIFWIWISVIVPTLVNGTFNLWISVDEVKNLLGLSKELYYVREGVLNSYALQFTVPVPPQVKSLHFTWQAIGQKPLPYTASIEISDQSLAMETPQLNISSKGFIPVQHPQTFQLSFPCTGILSDESYLQLRLDVVNEESIGSNPKVRKLTSNTNTTTTIILKRKRICLKDSSFKSSSTSTDHPQLKNFQSDKKLGAKNNKKQQNNTTSTTERIQIEEHPTSASSNLIYILTGCGIGLVLILITLTSVAFLWIRTKKILQDVNSTESNGFLRGTINGSSSTTTTASSSSRNHYLGTKNQPSIVVDHDDKHHYSSLSLSPCKYESEYSFPTSFLPNQKYSERDSTLYSEVPYYNHNYITKSNRCNNNKLSEILTIPRCKVRLESIILEGTFAKIYNGTVLQSNGTETNVIVKTVNDHSSPVQMALLLHEGLSLVGLSHEHVLSVIGVAAEDHVPPFLIYPDQGFSNLKRFLLHCRSGTGRPITIKEIVRMGIQIGNGLSFLHSQNFVHRDIATRNCVVDNKLLVKVSDFALSRDLFPDDYDSTGREPEGRPIKWSSPEVILHNRTSISADMWSFGVLLWELSSRAQQPYSDVPVSELLSVLQMGYRLDQPANCPDELYSCMTRCWKWDEEDRPKCPTVLSQLTDLHSQLAQYV